MRPYVILLTLLSFLIEPDESFRWPGPGLDPWFVEYTVEANTRYDQLPVRSIHNAYAKDASLFEQLAHHAVRSLELDIVPTKCDDGGCPSECAGLDCGARDDDWFVFHPRVFLPDEHETSCLRLSDCLEDLRAFHLHDPEHSVVTVFLDLKRKALLEHDRRTADDLDRRLEEHIPRAWTFTPADLAERCFGRVDAGNLAAAATTCGWPLLSELVGKFIFVLTGEDGTDRYVGQGSVAHERRAFGSTRLITHDKPWIVFSNLRDRDLPVARVEAPGDGLIRRVYAVGRCIPLFEVCAWAGGLDEIEVPRSAGQHLVTDRVRLLHDPRR